MGFGMVYPLLVLLNAASTMIGVIHRNPVVHFIDHTHQGCVNDIRPLSLRSASEVNMNQDSMVRRMKIEWALLKDELTIDQITVGYKLATPGFGSPPRGSPSAGLPAKIFYSNGLTWGGQKIYSLTSVWCIFNHKL